MLFTEEAFRIEQRIKDVGENAGVAADSPEDKAILILNFSLDDPMAEDQVLLRGWDMQSPIGGRPKAGAGHAEGSEDFPCTEAVQSLAGDHLKRLAQQDESRVGILGTASGGRLEGQSKAGIEEFLTPSGPLEQADVAGQARGMGEQHAQSHLAPRAAGSFALGEARKQLDQRLV